MKVIPGTNLDISIFIP